MFVNWSGNLSNFNPILYPTTKDEIADILHSRTKVKVVGSSHSISPVICSLNEDLTLISLKNFHLDPDLILDQDEGWVEVNAGWTLSQLYDELIKKRLFIRTLTASPAFTIGGIVSFPVHGSRLGAGFFVDEIISFTVMDSFGEYRLYHPETINLGVILSVRFKIHSYPRLMPRITKYYNPYPLIGHPVEYLFRYLIQSCQEEKLAFNQFFYDLHRNLLLNLHWQVDSEECSTHNIMTDEDRVKKSWLMKFINKKIFPNYRQSPFYLKLLGTIAELAIQTKVECNYREHCDSMWLSTGERAYFCEYIIPVMYEDEELDMNRINAIFQVVIDQVQAFRGRKFNLDLPMEGRFIKTQRIKDGKYQMNERSGIYLCVEIVCGAENLILDSSKITKYHQLNADFREFFRGVETGWQKLGGVPHLCKMFGFGHDPFEKVSEFLGEEVKTNLRQTDPTFHNLFLEKIIS